MLSFHAKVCVIRYEETKRVKTNLLININENIYVCILDNVHVVFITYTLLLFITNIQRYSRVESASAVYICAYMVYAYIHF